jgi:DNA-binding MarR family transcriptional regulator
MFLLRDLPKYEVLLAHSRRYQHVEPDACEAFLVLLRVASDVLAAGESWMARQGLSQGRFTVLMLLNRDPERGLSPSDLAERSGVTRATMTGLLDGLERDELIKREPHSGDRRMLVVTLTEKGRTHVDTMLPDYFRRIADLMKDIGHEDRITLSKLLRQVGSRVDAIARV